MQTIHSDLQKNILDELRWEPGVDSSRIGVTVEQGVVELTGHVRTLWERRMAETAVKRVRGVTAVANELEVDLLAEHVRGDVDIAKAAKDVLRWQVHVPDDKITVTVSKGWVTLEGKVPFSYQRFAAETAVEFLTGVIGVTNKIAIAPALEVSATDIRRKLNTALHRYAQLEADAIKIDADGSRLTLTGTVHSWAERELAQDAAWKVPGVTRVDNKLAVSWSR